MRLCSNDVRTLGALIWVILGCLATEVQAQENLVANPGFEQQTSNGFFANWSRGLNAKTDTVLFLETREPRTGQACLRMRGMSKGFTTCPGKSISVKPETEYWVTWWFKARQPLTSRTYLFLQTNLGQRVFPLTDRNGDFEWTFNIVRYRTLPGETSLHPVLTMQTTLDMPGTSWWDEIGVWERLPPEFEATYRQEHPWNDVSQPTSQWLAETADCTIWADRPEARIYPQTTPPAKGTPEPLSLTAPGGGHDVLQLVVTPRTELGPVSLEFSLSPDTDELPATSLSYRVAHCVPVQEVRDKTFPLGPTPDPLVAPGQPESVQAGKNTLFWIDWAAPRGAKARVTKATVKVLAGGKPIASIPLRLRRWNFDLPEVSHYRTMVMVSPHFIRQYCPGVSEEEAYRLAWDLLSKYRLSGFNIALWPNASLKDGTLQLDWSRFDRLLEAAKQYRASALTIGPMLGGGCSEGWKPRKIAGFMPLADPPFDELYVELNRQIGQRLRQAGMLDKAYVYPYDEAEPDYMDKIARLCDLVHQGDPELKCLMTTAPQLAEPLWGKVKAWIVPATAVRIATIDERRASGDEIWLYNMTASIEALPIKHRLFMWRSFQLNCQGGLLWNCCWWNKINPWENPTAAPVPTGRKRENLYRYQAGQASLFYPNPAGNGPLVPSLRLVLIRQGVEDFDMFTELLGTRRELLTKLSPKAAQDDLVTKTRYALIAPVIFDSLSFTSSQARTEALRQLVGNELEVARQTPAVIAYPARTGQKIVAAGYAESGTHLWLNDQPVPLDNDGHFEVMISENELAAGVNWRAEKDNARKIWRWPGLR